MKLGIFADVHGNREALERVVGLLRERGAARFFCAGDIVGYGPDPAACIELVRGLPATTVAGNHDRGALGRQPAGTFNPYAREALVWTIGRLGDSEFRYLESLALVERDDPLHLVHASPSAPADWRYILSMRDAEEEMNAFDLPLCIIGHSHQPLAFELREGRLRLLEPKGFTVRPGSRYLVNVGSVGQPRGGDPRADCALYDTSDGRFDFFRLDYDIAAVQSRMKRVGLPMHLVERLATGR